MRKQVVTLAVGLFVAVLAVATGAVVTEGPDTAPIRSAGAQWVILVRHAEKATEPADDPALTPTGKLRAESIVGVVRHWAVDAIVTTQWQRTRATAAPLAESLGITPVVVATDNAGTAAHADKVAATVRGLKAGTVLVVGHSNTLPAIIAALGGPTVADIGDDEYAHLFVLQIGSDPARLMQARY